MSDDEDVSGPGVVSDRKTNIKAFSPTCRYSTLGTVMIMHACGGLQSFIHCSVYLPRVFTSNIPPHIPSTTYYRNRTLSRGTSIGHSRYTLYLSFVLRACTKCFTSPLVSMAGVRAADCSISDNQYSLWTPLIQSCSMSCYSAHQ